MEQMGDDLRSGTMDIRRGASMCQIKQTHLATRTRIGLEQQLAHRNQKADVTHFRRDILLPRPWYEDSDELGGIDSTDHEGYQE